MNKKSIAEPTIFEQVVLRHQKSIWLYLRFLGCDEALADDICQETFLGVRHIHFEDFEPQAEASYLRTTARRLVLKHHQYESKTRKLQLDLEKAETTWQSYEQAKGQEQTLLDALRQCLEKLSEKNRRILKLYYEQEYTYKKIAELEDMSTQGVKMALRRSKRGLETCIKRKS